MFCGSRGSERRLAKAVWRHLGWADDLILVLVNENLNSVVQQSTFGSDKCQNMSVSEHFWKLSCGKKCTLLWREAHFGVKSVKQFMLGPLLEVELWKKFTPLWCEAHFKVKKWLLNLFELLNFIQLELKTSKHTMLGRLLAFEMSKKCTLLWRESHLEVKSVKTPVRLGR